MQRSRTRSVVFCGLSIALLAVSAWISLPIGPVPFTLQTAVLVLILCVLTPAEAIVTVAGYLVLGAAGLPLFSSMRGGISVLAGPTGGFLVGFLLGIIAASLLRKLIIDRTGKMLLGDIVGSVILLLFSYGVGLPWLMVEGNMGFVAAFLAAVAPFLIPDTIKTVVAIGVARPVRIGVGRQTAKSKVKGDVQPSNKPAVTESSEKTADASASAVK